MSAVDEAREAEDVYRATKNFVAAVEQGEWRRGAEYVIERVDALIAAVRAECASEPLDVEALRTMVRGISLPPGPDFAWVDGHQPFIAAALEVIDRWKAALAKQEG